MTYRTAFTAVTLGIALLAAGCSATAQRGAIAGGGIGAGTGAIIGHQTGRAGEGALIGAAIGALSGALIGSEIDRSRQPRYHEHRVSRTGYYCRAEPCVAPPYRRTYTVAGRRWVPEREEIRVYTAPDGTKQEKRVIVPGHYE